MPVELRIGEQGLWHGTPAARPDAVRLLEGLALDDPNALAAGTLVHALEQRAALGARRAVRPCRRAAVADSGGAARASSAASPPAHSQRGDRAQAIASCSRSRARRSFSSRGSVSAMPARRWSRWFRAPGCAATGARWSSPNPFWQSSTRPEPRSSPSSSRPGSLRCRSTIGRPPRCAQPSSRSCSPTAPAQANRARGEELASIMFTSGTTGPQKGVQVAQLWYLWASLDVAGAMRYTSDDVLYTCLPLGHANAQDTTFGPALLSSARVVFDQEFSASRFWHRVAETGATAFNLIGNMAEVLLARPPEEFVEAPGPAGVLGALALASARALAGALRCSAPRGLWVHRDRRPRLPGDRRGAARGLWALAARARRSASCASDGVVGRAGGERRDRRPLAAAGLDHRRLLGRRRSDGQRRGRMAGFAPATWGISTPTATCTSQAA